MQFWMVGYLIFMLKYKYLLMSSNRISTKGAVLKIKKPGLKRAWLYLVDQNWRVRSKSYKGSLDGVEGVGF